LADTYLQAQIDSAHSRRTYLRLITEAMDHMGIVIIGDLAGLTGQRLLEYRAYLEDRDLAPKSKALALAALRSFLQWAHLWGVQPIGGDLIRMTLRGPTATVITPFSVLTEAEVGRILAAASCTRDLALLAVLLGAGLRAGEATGLDVSDLRPSDDDGVGLVLWVRQGKGRKDRHVPVRPEVAALIRAYLAEGGRILGSEGPLFRAYDRAADSRRGSRRLSTRSVGYIVGKCVAAAGIDAKRLSPHAMRHTYALRALRGGVPLLAVSKLLGHASVVTTQRYLDHMERPELIEHMPALPV
jgi:integrase/recombinase XerD